MHGNVREWCEDWFGAYPEKPVIDPVGPDTGSYRVVHGGTWDGDARVCLSACRLNAPPSIRYTLLGLRLLRVYTRFLINGLDFLH